MNHYDVILSNPVDAKKLKWRRDDGHQVVFQKNQQYGRKEMEKRPIWQQFSLGGVASGMSVFITNPMDVLKTRLQLQTSATKAGSSSTQYTGMADCFVKVTKTEGFSALWKGLEPALYRAGSYSATRMGLYEPIRDGFAKAAGVTKGTFYVQAGAGVIAGMSAACVGNPFDLVKVRMQAVPKPGQIPYRHTLHALTEVIKTDGIGGLWQGLAPSLLRSGVLTASQISVYDQCKTLVKTHLKMKEGYLVHFMAAMVSGVVTTTVASPFDVIRTRIMSNPKKYKGTFQVANIMIQSEGPLSLFKGWLPNYMRLGPQTLITFMVYEQLRKWLGWTAL